MIRIFKLLDIVRQPNPAGGTNTYERYTADSREQALAFLATKEVTAKYYYIEVKTPEGIFGRDIEGVYEV